jgi:hypothetical protein
VDASGSGMTLQAFSNCSLLVSLRLARCGLTALRPVLLANLFTLDLSHNELSSVSLHIFSATTNLRTLVLAYNSLRSVFSGHLPESGAVLPKMAALDLSGVVMPEVDMAALLSFHSVQRLNLSACGVRRVLSTDIVRNSSLSVLDVRGCPMTDFPPSLFKAMSKLSTVYSDNYKLCCAAVLPEQFDLRRCHSPSDEISSCDDLLRSDVNRIFLTLFSVMALTLNAASLGLRLRQHLQSKATSYGVLVLHLCVSDLVMGVYLAIILGADRMYRSQFLWEDQAWRHSPICKLAGFLALLSCETSALIICLITLDRFLVLRFPFSRIHFNVK